MDELASYLNQLTNDEKQDVLEFYSEYVMDADLKTDQEIIQKLGTPKQLSRKILADYSIKAVNSEQGSTASGSTARPQRNIRMIWLIILALLASPIAIPILIVLALGLFMILLVIVMVIVMTIIVIVAVAFGGVVSIVGGLAVISSSIPTSIFFIGIGLGAVGLTLIAAPIGFLIIKVLIEMAANFSKWIYNRFFKSRRQSKEV
ncbi:hypothetical protein FD16_GL001062 [Paucilactobacillus suebicus DSM 5007 = KCTC 3549]|uniref:Integral membrane protein n=2 Tax=Paucilactobacillus suebicus TaxID=152335 RepID=A0A0R1VZP5_9LACO|nr:hypothetical protein FD16_GL001062 [Paucilactobacillus suebicus DSM 5007 = KCTC 3549]